MMRGQDESRSRVDRIERQGTVGLAEKLPFRHQQENRTVSSDCDEETGHKDTAATTPLRHFIHLENKHYTHSAHDPRRKLK
jgi:hypothetical protein